MNRESKFNALSRNQKFQYLYYCAKANERFITNWIRKNLGKESDIADDYCTTVINANDFLKRILFPEIDNEIISEKELMLRGVADDVTVLMAELSDIKQVAGRFNVLAGLKLLLEVYNRLIDFFFVEITNDLDQRSFQIVLLGAVVSEPYNTFDPLIPHITNGILWKDLTDMEIAHPGVKILLNKFMDVIFNLVEGPL